MSDIYVGATFTVALHGRPYVDGVKIVKLTTLSLKPRRRCASEFVAITVLDKRRRCLKPNVVNLRRATVKVAPTND